MCKRFLIIEFVEKEDVKAKILLARKEIAYVDYTRTNFESAFGSYFMLLRSTPLLGGHRTLYLYEKIRKEGQ